MDAKKATQPSKASSLATLTWKHRRAVSRIAALLLIVIVVLQNVEPTRVDLLFWSVPAVPKLVLIAISAVLGAIGHAVFRSWWSSRSGTP